MVLEWWEIGAISALTGLLGVLFLGLTFRWTTSSRPSAVRWRSAAFDAATSSPAFKRWWGERTSEAFERALDSGLSAASDLWNDPERRQALLDPVFNYFEKRLNLRLANAAKGGAGPGANLQGVGGLLSGATGGANLQGIVGMIPGIGQFAPLLGMLGGGASSPEAAIAVPDSGAFKPGVK